MSQAVSAFYFPLPKGVSMSTQPSTFDRAGGCFESLRGGCMLGLWNCFFLGFIALMVYFFWSSFMLATQGEITTGRVIGMDESDSDGSTLYSPIFEYTVGGQRYEVNSGIASDPPSYRVGEEIPVRYLPTNPQLAEVDSPLNSPWLFGGGVAILGIAMVALNVVGMRRIWRGESIDDE
jgi:hypothetical protein